MSRKPTAKMPPEQRAKQFLPFAAVHGLDEALRQKEYEMGLVEQPELSEDTREELDHILQGLVPGDPVTLRCFREGEIFSFSGMYRGINSEGMLETDDMAIPADAILEITSDTKGDEF